jgi:hypothetical protein
MNNTIKVKVPKNIDYESLFSKIEVEDSSSIIELIDSIYLILSLVCPKGKYKHRFRKTNGFKPLNSAEMNELTRNRFSQVKRLLMNPEITPDGSILIEDKSYQVGVISKKYKLNENLYNNPGEKYVILDSYTSKRFIEHLKKKKEERKQFEDQYQYITQKFEKSCITIDDDVYNYIWSLQKELINNSNQYYSKDKNIKIQIHMNIGKLLSKCEKIKSKKFSTSISKKNHRFNSTITNLNKELRYYIKIDGKETIEVDTKNSQPYILATLLTNDFFASTTSDYSLNNIYPELYNKVLRFDTHNEIKNSKCTSTYDTGIIYNNDASNYTSNSLSIYYNKLIDVSCMYGTLWDSSEFKVYRNLPYETGIYDHLSEVFFNKEVSAAEIKNFVMYLLNASNKYIRNNIEVIIKFKSKFPTINSIIEKLNSLKNLPSAFSLLLQRCESHLFLKVGCKELYDTFEDIPFITIHDGIILPKENAGVVSKSLKTSIENYTKIPVGISFKETINPIDRIKDIGKEEWNEIVNNKFDLTELTEKDKYHLKIGANYFNRYMDSEEKKSEYVENLLKDDKIDKFSRKK